MVILKKGAKTFPSPQQTNSLFPDRRQRAQIILYFWNCKNFGQRLTAPHCFLIHFFSIKLPHIQRETKQNKEPKNKNPPQNLILVEAVGFFQSKVRMKLNWLWKSRDKVRSLLQSKIWPVPRFHWSSMKYRTWPPGVQHKEVFFYGVVSSMLKVLTVSNDVAAMEEDLYLLQPPLALLQNYTT